MRFRLSPVIALEVGFSSFFGSPPMVRPLGEITGEKNHHHHSTIFLHTLQNRIGNIPGMNMGTVHSRMREDHRGFRHIQYIVHRRMRDVGKVHNHAQSIHFPNDFPSKLGQPPMQWVCSCRICPIRMCGMGNSHISGTQFKHLTQDRQRVANGMPPSIPIRDATFPCL